MNWRKCYNARTDPNASSLESCVFTWDAENRLVKAVVNSTTVHYDYDHQSRLISRGAGVSPTTFTRYLYDGWNRIAGYESNGTGHTLKNTYLWGMDLSGTMQGAGGVGGLLSMSQISQSPIPNVSSYYPTYDGNGNVSEYVDGNGDKAAHFEYDPFGNLTVDSESNAAEFPYRFSTKPQDSITGLYYYGYRYYDPLTGRWPSGDPIEEKGGVNLYGFVGNDGVNKWDFNGLTAPWVTLNSPVGDESRDFGLSDDRLWDKLWASGLVVNNVKMPGIAGRVGQKVTPVGLPTIRVTDKDGEKCCLKFRFDHIVNKLEMADDTGGNYWGTAAHELRHIRALYKRAKGHADYYNKLPQPCFNTSREAAVARREYVKVMKILLDIEISFEGDHSQEGGYGTPSKYGTYTWDGNYDDK